MSHLCWQNHEGQRHYEEPQYQRRLDSSLGKLPGQSLTFQQFNKLSFPGNQSSTTA